MRTHGKDGRIGVDAAQPATLVRVKRREVRRFYLASSFSDWDILHFQ
jgi:hypothetical protein